MTKKMVGETGVEPAVRPPHRLGGVAKGAPYSSQRHPLVPMNSEVGLNLRQSKTLKNKKWSGRPELNRRPLGPELHNREDPNLLKCKNKCF